MAKDKSKSKVDEKPAKGKGKVDEKPAKSKKAKGNDDFAKPSDAPATGDSWKFEDDDNVGDLFLITPLREQTFKSDEYGDSQIVVADIVVINEKKPAKSELHEEVYIFGGWVKGALRGYIGERKVLGRLGKDASKTKSKAKDAFAWVLEDADDDDIEIAKAYLETVDPFVQGGKKSKGK